MRIAVVGWLFMMSSGCWGFVTPSIHTPSALSPIITNRIASTIVAVSYSYGSNNDSINNNGSSSLYDDLSVSEIKQLYSYPNAASIFVIVSKNEI